jgi:hypothetical protein
MDWGWVLVPRGIVKLEKVPENPEQVGGDFDVP